MRLLLTTCALTLLSLGFLVSATNAQGWQGQVIQAVFFGDRDGEGERIASDLQLDEEEVYFAITERLRLLYNLDSIGNLQYRPFVYSLGKYKEFKSMSVSDRSRAGTDPADLYFKVFVDIDPPSSTLLSANIIKTKVTVEVFVFDRDFQHLHKVEGKATTSGITSSPEDGYDPFFDLTKEEFWRLFGKALDEIHKMPK